MNSQMERDTGRGLGRSRAQQPLSPLSWVTSPLVWGSAHPPGSSANPMRGGFMEVSLCRLDHSLAPFPANSPVWRVEGEAENPCLQTTAGSFW